jgi:hypothetical protein
LRIAATGIQSALSSQALRERDRSDVYVRLSPIHGMGLFTRRTFGTGETMLVRDERPVTPKQPLFAAKGEIEAHCARLEGGRQVYLGYPERFINHSCDPNAFLRRLDGRNHVVALRPIRPRDEVVVHYGVNLSDGVPWQCNCGSERCLGLIPGHFFSLPLDVQIELSPLLAPWFVAEHQDAYRAFLREAGLPEEQD